MYKAYFSLSMELIRDIVRTLEEDMVANFDEESDKPVSASFNCPIPHGESSDATPIRKDQDLALLTEIDESQQGMRPVMEDISQEAIEQLVRSSKTLLFCHLSHQRAAESVFSFLSIPVLSFPFLSLFLAFETASLSIEGRLTFEEFRTFAIADPTIISWFEALGSVF